MGHGTKLRMIHQKIQVRMKPEDQE